MAKRPEDKKVADLPPPAEGGSYVVENGVRRRVEEPTKPRADDVAPAAAPAPKEG